MKAPCGDCGSPVEPDELHDIIDCHREWRARATSAEARAGRLGTALESIMTTCALGTQRYDGPMLGKGQQSRLTPRPSFLVVVVSKTATEAHKEWFSDETEAHAFRDRFDGAAYHRSVIAFPSAPAPRRQRRQHGN